MTCAMAREARLVFIVMPVPWLVGIPVTRCRRRVFVVVGSLITMIVVPSAGAMLDIITGMVARLSLPVVATVTLPVVFRVMVRSRVL